MELVRDEVGVDVLPDPLVALAAVVDAPGAVSLEAVAGVLDEPLLPLPPPPALLLLLFPELEDLGALRTQLNEPVSIHIHLISALT